MTLELALGENSISCCYFTALFIEVSFRLGFPLAFSWMPKMPELLTAFSRVVIGDAFWKVVVRRVCLVSLEHIVVGIR